ncbi:hypothetical protein [Streptomyces sp. B93]|uniref:hypothetical protein n=1 Tax=Streptomyces sp. B93 TaxID=2824875 RepID=UPI001B383310|nr:hypothetical protein [Streptomyces sp. B93]MBQ1092714.1 hypothetical protein [Streptomyces sp. B93]
MARPVADTALVLGVCLVALLGLLVQSRGLDTAAERTALPIVLASAGALCLRRRHPVALGAVALAATAGYGALLQQPGPITLVFVVALYTVVDEGHLAVAIGFGAASVVAFAPRGRLRRRDRGATGPASGTAPNW